MNEIPRQAALAFNKANAAWREKDTDKALSYGRKVVKMAPEFTSAHVICARCFYAQGKLNKAKSAYQKALSLDAKNFEAALELGNVLRGLEEDELSLASYARARKIRPDDPRPYLALALYWENNASNGAADSAASSFQLALDFANEKLSAIDICANIGESRLARVHVGPALEVFRYGRLLETSDTDDQSLMRVDIGIVECLLRLGLIEDAKQMMRTLSMSENIIDLDKLASLLIRFNFSSEALSCMRRATELAPDDASVFYKLADTAVTSWYILEGEQALNRAVELGLDSEDGILSLRGKSASRLGDSNRAFEIYDELIRKSSSDQFTSSGLMASLYVDNLTPQEIFERTVKLCEPWGKDARTTASFKNDKDPDRPLRIGMVSSDLHHQHPVNIYMQPVFERWDSENFPLTVYFTGNTADDQTRLARQRVGSWREVTDATLAAAVEQDEIDILIDLAGHTSGSAMRAFAKRLAPVQATYLGYPGTSGVPNIDWLIGDHIVCPPEMDHLYSEKIWRLPNTIFCYAPETDYPLPAFDENRQLTYGSFNNIAKLSVTTLKTWAEILIASPDSQLLLRAPSFADQGIIEKYKKIFTDYGIEDKRIILKGPISLTNMMQSYGEIDIALDPFPYGGGTTTHQAMWMGVPVITLLGSTFVGRMSSSFLTAAGLSDWVSKDLDEYVKKAVQFGSDRQKLTQLKRGLREQQLACTGWKPDYFTKDFQNALRGMWKEMVTKITP